MKVLVLGGTGTVGSQVAAELLARKAEVHVLTRSAEKAATLPPGAHAVIGDCSKSRPSDPRFRVWTGCFS